ncbi:helix-turn-helix domain-containing protein [Ureibacillus sinduriensis]|uniref:helix-turn-helix domain-containing protein n=1 Tax=Ureibacillus sinduriensis TaxID=561440 RepID=UPI00068AF6D8|nr:helix-turn-helix domain-containing protein [Ureibacillus sinduriensis]
MDRITLTVKETAELLGISLTTIYSLVKTNDIPHTKVKGKILFHRNTVEKWLIDGASKTEKGGDLDDSSEYQSTNR